MTGGAAGIRCPECGSGGMRVTDSRPTPGSRRRRYLCGCGGRLTTWESCVSPRDIEAARRQVEAAAKRLEAMASPPCLLADNDSVLLRGVLRAWLLGQQVEPPERITVVEER